jgi:hypothetical protein
MSMPLRRGDQARLGRYELIGRLGSGGMGTVYLGLDPGERQVAIKVVRPEFANDPEFRARFRSEVNRARQVPPFSTAEVLDADPDHDPPYLVVEYVDGPSLDVVIRERGPLAGSALHSVAVGIATALSAIHGAGVIHRDLKPGNVLLAPGGIKVIDFGIARAFEATSRHTRTDQMVGTVAYMAPERFEPEHQVQVTAAADVFAWGAVVAYAASGRTPFDGDSAASTAMRILTQPPDLSGLPPTLRVPVELALAKDPRDRPTARELLDMLLAGNAPTVPNRAVDPRLPAAAVEPRPAAATGLSPVPPPVDAPVVPVARPRRRGSVARTAAVSAVAALVLFGAGVGLRLQFGDSSSASPVAGASTPAARPSSAPPSVDPHAAILRGNRRALIHVAEIDRDLALDLNSAEVEVSDGTGAKSLFQLVPYGVDYAIKSLRGAPETCLGVKIVPDRESSLVPTECAPTKATLFSLAPTGRKDDKGRPTYLISNEAYGFVQWSPDRKVMFVQEVGDAAPLSSFSFVARGPA